jgi:hypothetical protein
VSCLTVIFCVPSARVYNSHVAGLFAMIRKKLTLTNPRRAIQDCFSFHFHLFAKIFLSTQILHVKVRLNKIDMVPIRLNVLKSLDRVSKLLLGNVILDTRSRDPINTRDDDSL